MEYTVLFWLGHTIKIFINVKKALQANKLKLQFDYGL